MRNSLATQYCREVSKHLPGKRNHKSALIADLQSSVMAYLEENPDADISQIRETFGTPQQIAASYVDAMSADEILVSLDTRKRIATSVTALVTVIILFCCTSLGMLNGTLHRSNVDYRSEKIDIYYMTYFDRE